MLKYCFSVYKIKKIENLLKRPRVLAVENHLTFLFTFAIKLAYVIFGLLVAYVSNMSAY